MGHLDCLFFTYAGAVKFYQDIGFILTEDKRLILDNVEVKVTRVSPLQWRGSVLNGYEYETNP